MVEAARAGYESPLSYFLTLPHSLKSVLHWYELITVSESGSDSGYRFFVQGIHLNVQNFSCFRA